MLSETPEENKDITPNYIKDTNVYLKSRAILTYNREDGDNPEILPCYRVEFHARFLEGKYKHLSVLVTKLFYPPVINPLNNVYLDTGMIVQVSGTLSAHSHTPRGITAFFYLEADVIKRDICFSEARKEHHNQRLVKDPQCRLNTKKLGEFLC
jgi:hypothetical protein